MELSSCRICLQSDNIKLQSLFQVNNDKSYAVMVNFSAGVEVLENDGLPQYICVECMDQIEVSCKIKQKCIDSDIVLHQNLKHFKKNEDKFAVPLTEKLNFIETEIEKNDLNALDCLIDKFPAKELRKINDWKFKCFICNKSFTTVKIMKIHIKNNHSNAKNCTICDEKIKTPISLNYHIMSHSHGYSNICHFCGKGFQITCKLTAHIKKIHTKSNTIFTCDLCGVSTKLKEYIAKHMKTVHMKIKKFKCIHCEEREYSTQMGLNSHLYRYHEVEAPIKCPDCNTGFTFNSELRGHINNLQCTGSPSKRSRNITKKKYYTESKDGIACIYCSKISSNTHKASMHFIQFHKISKKCNKCGKLFITSTYLSNHMKQIHGAFKPFRCETCGKTFTQKHSLECHRNTHTGEKPYSCDLCLFKAGDRSTISKHKKNIHKNTN